MVNILGHDCCKLRKICVQMWPALLLAWSFDLKKNLYASCFSRGLVERQGLHMCRWEHALVNLMW